MAPGTWSAVASEDALALASEATYCRLLSTALSSPERVGAPLPACRWELRE